MDIYHYILHTSLFKHMGNLPSCCGIISRHMYPLELPQMAPFCTKILFKKIWGRTPRPPFNHDSFTYYNIYASAHIGYLQKYLKKKTNKQKKKNPRKSCPGPASLLNQHSYLPQPPCLFLLIQNLSANENKYSGLKIPENIFSGRAHADNK